MAQMTGCPGAKAHLAASSPTATSQNLIIAPPAQANATSAASAAAARATRLLRRTILSPPPGVERDQTVVGTPRSLWGKWDQRDRPHRRNRGIVTGIG